MKIESVNHPEYYKGEKFECIEVMGEALGADVTSDFCIANAFKYLYRCMRKHEDPREDIQKAIVYLQKYLDMKGKEK